MLEKEFAALQIRDIESLEAAQSEKVLLLSQISEGWDSLHSAQGKASATDSDAALKALLISCKEKHARNDIILRRQIEEVRTVLNTLTMQTKNQTQEVYNKLGKLID